MEHNEKDLGSAPSEQVCFIPQNTGWTAGLSWFTTSDTITTTYEEAVAVNKAHKKMFKQAVIKYRVMKKTVTFEICTPPKPVKALPTE